MPRGTLEVLLVNAKGLDNSADFLSNIDPYVILQHRDQEHKSSVQKEAGSNPEWNETFLFSVYDQIHELKLTIMDKDNHSADEFLGEAIIPLEPVIHGGNTPIAAYNVVKGGKYCGEIRIALSFFPQE